MDIDKEIKEIHDTTIRFMKQRKQAAKSKKSKGLTDEEMKEAIEAAKRVEKSQKEYETKLHNETEEDMRKKKKF